MSDPSPKGAAGDLQERRDRRSIQRIARADEDAFTELFGRYGPASRGLAVRIIGDRTIAEEVVQDVFASIWQRARSYDPARGTVRTWVLTQVHHRAVGVVRRLDASRRRGAGTTGPVDMTPHFDDVIEGSWLADRRTQVRRALEQLPDEHREMIELAYFQGLTQSQISMKSGVPLGTVRSRTLTAMRRLRALMGGDT